MAVQAMRAALQGVGPSQAQLEGSQVRDPSGNFTLAPQQLHGVGLSQPLRESPSRLAGRGRLSHLVETGLFPLHVVLPRQSSAKCSSTLVMMLATDNICGPAAEPRTRTGT